MIDNNEIHNSIVTEFHISDNSLKQMEQSVETLTKARINICKLLNVSDFKDETVDSKEKQFITIIDENKYNIKDCEKKQIELKAEIKVKKQEIKVIKLHINKLEQKHRQEKLEGRKFRESLRIFISREKFKIIKRLLIRRYREVFLKYSSELSIKTKIDECNARKDKIRREKQNFNNTLDSYNKKIIIDKKVLSEMRKSIINMQKTNSLNIIKLQSIKDYKKIENKFRLEVQNCG